MKSLILALVMMVAAQAQADGFECYSEESSLRVKIYNHTQPEKGTRNEAIVILSDSDISHGRKTIATFSDAQGLFRGSSSVYVGKVDLRFNSTGRKGEAILGTKLGELAEVIVRIDFSYANPLANGEEVDAWVGAIKRNGDSVGENMVCARYLKN